MTDHSQPCGEVKLLHDQKVLMRDGVRLSADIYLPRAPGPFPTIVTRTPYESGRDSFIDLAIWFAQRGYAFVVQDCRGRYESEGVFRAYSDEAHDGYDTLEWVADQSWCDGKIGTWGRSYGGLTQWLMAPLESPHLTCMAPHVICDDFHSDCHYVGGAFQLLLSLGAAIIWETNLATVIGPNCANLFQNQRFLSQLPLIDMDVAAIGRKIPYWREWLEHGNNDDYWKPFSTVGQHNRVDVPIFQQCGWYDAYAGSTFRNFSAMVRHGKSERARTGQKVLIGPWSHEEPDSSRLGDVDFGPDSLLPMREQELRWFDHWLKGIDDGLMDEPPIQFFVTGINQWRFEQQWPPENMCRTPHYLHSGGHANSLAGDGSLSPDPPGVEPPDRFEYDPKQPVPTLGGNLSIRLMTQNAQQPIVPGPVDQRPIERRDDVLVYTSRRLEQDLEITGPIDVTLYAASSARDTDFTVRLVDVQPSGRANFVAEGILRARYRHSDRQAELLEPDEVDEFRIAMYPASHVFMTGHRIRFDVSSSNFPRFSRNLNTGEDVATGTRMQVARQTILHTSQYPSHVLLPIIPTQRPVGRSTTNS